MERAGEKEMETEKHSLGADQAQLMIGPSMCVCVCVCEYCGHWLWLPRLPALLEMPAVVMCCDRG